MKRILIFLLLLVSPDVFAQELDGVAAGAWSKVVAETANRIAADALLMPLAGQKTSTGNISMADGYALEIATGSLSNLTLRLRGFPTTGIYADATTWRQVILGVETQKWSVGSVTFLVNISNASETTLASASIATLTVGAGSLTLPSIHGPTAGDGISFFPNYIRFSIAGINAMDIISTGIALRKAVEISAGVTVTNGNGVCVGTSTTPLPNTVHIISPTGATVVDFASAGVELWASGTKQLECTATQTIIFSLCNLASETYLASTTASSSLFAVLSRAEIASLVNARMATDVLNCSSGTVRTNLDVYSKSETAALVGGGYSGNAYTFSVASASNRLPVNSASESIALASGGIFLVKATVQSQVIASAESLIWELRSCVSANNGSPFTVGASETRLDAWGSSSPYSAHIFPNGDLQCGFEIVASGPINSAWRVLKVEVVGQ